MSQEAARPNDDEVRELEVELAPSFGPVRQELRRWLSFITVSALILSAVFVYRDAVGSFLRGERTLAGSPRFSPAHEVSDADLSRVQLGRVHAELIPRWTYAMATATNANGRGHADRVFHQLEEALAPDPNLQDLWREAHMAVRHDPLVHARRLDYLFWAHNHYLERHRQPYRLEAAFFVVEERAQLHTLSYEVLVDARSSEGHAIRLVRRIDPLSTVEGWLGKTRADGEGGALILMRRVLHFAVRHVWTALHPALDERRPAPERPWLMHVRREMRAALPPHTYELLSESAVDQQTLIEVAASIEARAACGNTFRIHSLPYNGLSRRDRGVIEHALVISQLVPDCPPVTLDEAARLVGASERLSDMRGIEDAVEQLAVVVARAVATHELRHLADGESPACPGCPEALEGETLAEVSAYLAAFADPELGYVSLLQACASSHGQGAQGRALRSVLEAILPYGCDGPTRHDLALVARAYEEALFGPRPIVRTPDFPSQVHLLPRRPRRPRPPPVASALPGGWGLSLRADESR